jgi:hypothetical protein
LNGHRGCAHDCRLYEVKEPSTALSNIEGQKRIGKVGTDVDEATFHHRASANVWFK